MRLVSPELKEVIDGSPILWRRVDLLAGYSFVGRQVKRTNGVPLWVQTDVSQHKVFGAAWIVAHSDLIERLTLFVASDENNDSPGIVTDIFDVARFSCLRRLHIRRAGPSGGRILSLPAFPTQLVDPSALTHIECISYPASALASNIFLRVIRLEKLDGAPGITPVDLQNVLPVLPLLSSLTIGGRLVIDSGTPRCPPSVLSSLTEFAFLGSIESLDHLFAAFLLPGIASWVSESEVGTAGIPAGSRLRDILRICAALPTKVMLRWVSSTESQVQIFDGASPRAFSLQLSLSHTTPCPHFRIC